MQDFRQTERQGRLSHIYLLVTEFHYFLTIVAFVWNCKKTQKNTN